MNSPSKHSRKSNHSHVRGMYWAARASSIGMQLAVPAGLGFLADWQFGTAPGLTVAGVCLGFVLTMLELFRLANGNSGPRQSGDREPKAQNTSASTEPTDSTQ